VSGDQNETAKSNLGRGTRGDHIIHISVKVQAKDRGVKRKKFSHLRPKCETETEEI
jgi:hypothetical protein